MEGPCPVPLERIHSPIVQESRNLLWVRGCVEVEWRYSIFNLLQHVKILWTVLIPRGLVKSWKRKFGGRWVIPCVGAKGFPLPREDEGCGPRE